MTPILTNFSPLQSLFFSAFSTSHPTQAIFVICTLGMQVRKKAKAEHQCQVVLGPGVREPRVSGGHLCAPTFCDIPQPLLHICLVSYFSASRVKGGILIGVRHLFLTVTLTFTWNPDTVVHRLFYSFASIHLKLFMQPGCILCLSLLITVCISLGTFESLALHDGTVSNIVGMPPSPISFPFSYWVPLQALWVVSW